jgi:hypothetical protein
MCAHHGIVRPSASSVCVSQVSEKGIEFYDDTLVRLALLC